MKQLIKVGNICVAGVYKISDESGNILYIGSGIKANERRNSHMSNLKYNLYENRSKKPLQDAFNSGNLYFEMIHVSANNKQVDYMNEDEKESLQMALSVLEEFYINLYKDTVCNKIIHVVKHSSKGNSITFLKRHFSSLGENNPNCKINKRLAANILWLKLNGFDTNNIRSKLQEQSIYLSQSHICNIGIHRWKSIIPIEPCWINEKLEYGA